MKQFVFYQANSLSVCISVLIVKTLDSRVENRVYSSNSWNLTEGMLEVDSNMEVELEVSKVHFQFPLQQFQKILQNFAQSVMFIRLKLYCSSFHCSDNLTALLPRPLHFSLTIYLHEFTVECGQRLIYSSLDVAG